MTKFYNYFTLDKQDKIKFNKELITEYPFLLPRDWEGNIPENYDYSWTEVDEIPEGWLISFGELLFNELKEECEKFNYLNDLRFVQVKEKFGGLRIYTNGYPKDAKIDEIIEKYSLLSENICIECGKPDVPMVMDGWISPYCEYCWTHHCLNHFSTRVNNLDESIELYKELTKNSEIKMSDIYSYTRYSKDKGKEEFNIDISETSNKIRHNYNK